MKRHSEALSSVVSAMRKPFARISGQSPRTVMLGTVMVASSVSVVTSFVLGHYYSVDMTSSLIIFSPADCYLDWGLNVGRHCFSDYAIPMSFGTRANPWDPYPLYFPPDYKPASSNYPAAGMVVPVAFGLLGKWLGSPRTGMAGYLLLLTIAVFTPAVWAARGARGLERLVVFIACGIAAIPAWMVIDRGNVVGFLAPIGLCFLVALCRSRWGLVATMVILAALVKPQFAVLAVVLFAARRWRLGGVAVAGVVLSNVAAYALWPRDFPRTIVQSIHYVLGYSSSASGVLATPFNVSFGKLLLAVPDGIKARESGGKVPDGFLMGPRSLIGYVVLLVIVAALLALGRRIPPLMAGIVLLATASLFPALTNPYYLVFALPIAALVARAPDGPPGTGILDRTSTVSGRRRVVGVCISLAVALTIAAVPVPGTLHHMGTFDGGTDNTWSVVLTTVFLAPLLWLVTCVAIIASYMRRPAEPSTVTEAAAETSRDTRVDSYVGPT